MAILFALNGRMVIMDHINSLDLMKCVKFSIIFI